MRMALWIVGGILCATGILSLLFAFETPFGGDMATTLDKVGWDGMGDISTTPRFVVSLLGIGLGLPILVGLNATAWKQTGGY